MALTPKSTTRFAYLVITNDDKTPETTDTMADFCDANDPDTDLSYHLVSLVNRRKNEVSIEAHLGKGEAVFDWTKVGLITNGGVLVAQRAEVRTKPADKEITLRWRLKFHA